MRKILNIRFFRSRGVKDDHGEPGLNAIPAHTHPSGLGSGHHQGPQDDEKSLSDCQEDDRLVIRRIQCASHLRRRLLEMGLNPGAAIRIVKYAPLKDPLECEIKGYHLALRVSEARAIFVTPLIT